MRRVWVLVKIACPSVRTPEFTNLIGQAVLMVIRTYLSIYLATIKGSIVNAIVLADPKLFF